MIMRETTKQTSARNTIMKMITIREKLKGLGLDV